MTSPSDIPSPAPASLVPLWPAPLTKQATFERAYQWAATHPRCTQGSSCLYRNDTDTNACLIGACIPDEVYEDAGRPAVAIETLIDDHGSISALFADEVTEPFLTALQKVHDLFEVPGMSKPDDESSSEDVTAYHAAADEAYPTAVLPNLRAFAAQWGLTVPEVAAS